MPLHVPAQDLPAKEKEVKVENMCLGEQRDGSPQLREPIGQRLVNRP